MKKNEGDKLSPKTEEKIKNLMEEVFKEYRKANNIPDPGEIDQRVKAWIDKLDIPPDERPGLWENYKKAKTFDEIDQALEAIYLAGTRKIRAKIELCESVISRQN